MADDAQKLPGHHVYADILHRAALEGRAHAVRVGQMLYLQYRFQCSLPFRLLGNGGQDGICALLHRQGGEGHVKPVFAQPVQQVHRVRHRQSHRPQPLHLCEDLPGRAVHNDFSVVHDHNPVGVLRLVHVVGDEDDRDALLAVELFDGLVVMDGKPREVFTRKKELEDIGLAVPDTVSLLFSLREAGMDVPVDAITVEECADAIAKNFT